ncbi:zf-HC2 domain-containing protein [Corynebacterium genitalium ATCC 33030]|uniref:Putative zinc-finger domain-containing protein n=1 Tax=Corynebacterium genitalium ATCC 33030 TaxID=585529 RepID=D7WDM5_9CORY|nr:MULTISPECIES: zf-HC2 domain-containing protein [Corynebacterium]MCQ4619408.1 zf-HC2 domain-containing protein [Corynebacterium pseudogenitalium]EFK54256.1 hypothetical protein HMPREF0291_11913 [Corynebacterium genitalium ATCC 33030]MCQ4619660.1 zf-HC2 domain-containing protein [Corynebacterium sp. CCUG 71335]MCQ4621859.1 zf-HC2 domain-containing protein [Corynebacterium sp. CCUG 70398]UUA90218.1 zf-HC2 domain-containing protein [Corynebacterium genitalium ATCC 33030]
MRQFDSIDHLSYEAVAALIDGELSPSATQRAHSHLAECSDCREETQRQQAAAAAVRLHNGDGCLRAPRSLVEKLALMTDGEIPAEETHSLWSKLRGGLK